MIKHGCASPPPRAHARIKYLSELALWPFRLILIPSYLLLLNSSRGLPFSSGKIMLSPAGKQWRPRKPIRNSEWACEGRLQNNYFRFKDRRPRAWGGGKKVNGWKRKETEWEQSDRRARYGKGGRFFSLLDKSLSEFLLRWELCCSKAVEVTKTNPSIQCKCNGWFVNGALYKQASTCFFYFCLFPLRCPSSPSLLFCLSACYQETSHWLDAWTGLLSLPW